MGEKEKEDEKKEEEISESEKRIRQIAISYYSREDIQKAIFQFSENREVVPRYYEGFGKRPDSLQYKNDIFELVKKGATSFHCSEELWKDPLQLSTEMDEEKLNDLRQGFDLLIDIDSKYLDYSKIAAELFINALKFHNVKNISVKFSGSKGMHIIVPWKAFPEEINRIRTSNMFPEWPRIISKYLTEIIKKELVERISEMTGKGIVVSKYIKGEEEVGDAVKKVMPDIILVSPRHLFRMPYSLHEKTSLASIVIPKDKIAEFEPRDADPLKVKPLNFLPEPRKNEARELLIQALDWYKEKSSVEKETGKEKKAGEYKEIVLKDVREELFPPCIKNILKGLKDGKKRALFLLINFFRLLNLEQKEIEQRIADWNKKNPKPLKQGYIDSQLSWHFKQKKILPPNCDKENYKDINVCEPDEFCKLIKNPVNYTIKKYKDLAYRRKTERK